MNKFKNFKLMPCLAAVILCLTASRSEAQTPGGIGNTNYRIAAWLTPENYNPLTGTWTNRILSSATGSVGNFSQSGLSGTLAYPAGPSSPGFNFHPAVRFDNQSETAARNHIASAGTYTVTSGSNTTAIFVLNRKPRSGQTIFDGYDYLMSFGDGIGNSICWYAGNTNEQLDLFADNNISNAFRRGIIAIDNANNGANPLIVYNNGAESKPAVTINATIAPSKIDLAGGGASRNGGYYGFEGDIQEVIVLNAVTADRHIAAADMQKIHSYLAIKYGLQLNNMNNYVNSQGNTVWTRNTQYNSGAVFGIARDDASALYQKQATGANNNVTVFAGSDIATFNNNNDGSAGNGVYLLFCANSTDFTSTVQYFHSAIPAPGGGSVSVRSTVSLKVQLTGQATPFEVGFKLNAERKYRYILKSSSPDFEPALTTVFPVAGYADQLFRNITVSDGDYISFAGEGHDTDITPGGIDASNLKIAAWLTPENYILSTGTWINRITGSNSVGNFSQANVYNVTPGALKPPSKPSVPGYNFHPAIHFESMDEASAVNHIASDNNYNVTANTNVTTILVFNRKMRPNATDFDNYDYMLTFTNSLSDYPNSIGWFATGMYTRDDIDIFADVPSATATTSNGGVLRKGILTVDNANSGANSLHVYKNGSRSFSSTATKINSTSKISLAGATSTRGAYDNYGFDGDIQEVIVLSAASGGHLEYTDIQKIHSYLSIKYGLTLDNREDYLNSDGNIVWTYDPQYNCAVFGIAHDSKSALYQKQSRNLNNDLTVFAGSGIATFNSDNDGSIDNGVYLLFGANGEDLHFIENYNNANIQVVNPANVSVRSRTSFKVQLTGQPAPASFNVGFKLNADMKYRYLLKSTSPNFEPANTTLYEIDNYSSEGLDAQMFSNISVQTGDYIAFAGEGINQSGSPGGVSKGLTMWLRADDTTPGAIDTTQNVMLQWDGGQNNNYISNTLAWKNLKNPSGNLQTVVNAWKDIARNIIYDNVTQHIEKKRPVYLKRHYLMNYNPALDFYTNWGVNGTNMSAFLSTRKSPMSVDKPANSTIIAVINSAVRPADGDNTYFIAWHNPEIMTDYTQYFPGYGFQSQLSGSSRVGRPRLRLNDFVDIDQRVFNPGETTIASYQLTNVPTGNRYIQPENIRVGFNMQEGTNPAPQLSSATWYMNTNGSIGGTLYHTRSMRGMISEIITYERALNDEEKVKVNSYYAFKYGLTLKPNTTGYNNGRFDYKLSGGEEVWPGKSVQNTSDYAIFYNNLAAIVRDDAALLNNRQAHSTDVGSIVHLGVAGQYTAYDGDPSGLGYFEYDQEAVMVGNNKETGTTTVINEICGPQEVFNRTWMIHKKTNNDRPIPLIISAQSNAGNNLSDPSTAKYESVLNKNYQLYMIAAEDKESINPNNTQTYGKNITVIPMTWLNGEHQCIYILNRERTFITFGYKEEIKACTPETTFHGTKTYRWQDWTEQNYGTNWPTISKSTEIDLGNEVKITGTKVTYDNPVKTIRNYPRANNGYLRIARSGGQFSSEGNTNGNRVTVEINMNSSTLVDFHISGLDGLSNSYAAVKVTGYCINTDGTVTSTIVPELSYEATPSASSYKITGNRAEVQRNQSNGSTSPRGKVNVRFPQGVMKIVIEYYMMQRVTSSIRWLYISPINLRAVPPPPVVNEDGLSFVTDVDKDTITTCQPVQYIFRIQNTNCTSKTINFLDILPEGLQWKENGIRLNEANADNESLEINNYAGTRTLEIKNLIVPGEGTLLFTATAVINPGIEEYHDYRKWGNKAEITYDRIVGNDSFTQNLWSMDMYTHDEYTYFFASWEKRNDKVKLTTASHPSKYGHNSSIQVTLTVTNPNPDAVPSTFLNLSWNEEFSYLYDDQTGIHSLEITGIENDEWKIVNFNKNDHSLLIAKTTTGDEGFKIPGNNSPVVITFILKAPATMDELVDELDENGMPVIINGKKKKIDLLVGYEFWSKVNDSCIIESLVNLDGEIRVPHQISKPFIIINQHVSDAVY
ncbi:MAG: hypothetical protein LBC47_05015 [Tannerella sp.]|jgi:hypothetical protein|nr:hypothetical protein [Tannerella sp.]